MIKRTRRRDTVDRLLFPWFIWFPRSFIYNWFLIYACNWWLERVQHSRAPFGYLDSQSKSEHSRALRLRRFPKIADICSVDLFIGYCHGLPAYTVLRPAVWILKPLRLVPLHCDHLWLLAHLGEAETSREARGSNAVTGTWVSGREFLGCKEFVRRLLLFIFGRLQFLLLFVKQFAVFGSGGLWRRGVLLPHNEDGQTRWLRTRDRSLMKQRWMLWMKCWIVW